MNFSIGRTMSLYEPKQLADSMPPLVGSDLRGLATVESPSRQDSIGEVGSRGRAKNPTQIHSLQGPKFNRLRDGSCAG